MWDGGVKFPSCGNAAMDKVKTLTILSLYSLFLLQVAKLSPTPGRLISFLAHETVHGQRSFYKGKASLSLPKVAPSIPPVSHAYQSVNAAGGPPLTAKTVLDAEVRREGKMAERKRGSNAIFLFVE